jgi:hypothetical protein
MANQDGTITSEQAAIEMADRMARRNAQLRDELAEQKFKYARLRTLLMRLIHPEDLGHAVSAEVRWTISEVLERVDHV